MLINCYKLLNDSLETRIHSLAREMPIQFLFYRKATMTKKKSKPVTQRKSKSVKVRQKGLT